MAQPAPEFTIFYAWQSDTPGAHNRNLIEEALNEACEQLGADAAIPYVITLTKDTQGVPGLCDIPAAILGKIESADAVVLDLTFIAKTAAEKPKYCPNPNMLFELGYAFHAVGFDRLICVMNEAHGPATEMLFDLAHRRHPVRYKSPASGKTKKQIASTLADALVNALRPTVLLGPHSLSVDSEQEFEREATQIREQWQSTRSSWSEGGASWPVVQFSFRPVHYQERRWPDAKSLNDLLNKHQCVRLDGMSYYPPMQSETDVTSWGLYNERYGSPVWSFCYSGQFWAAINIGAGYQYPRTQRDMSFYPDSASEPIILAGRWIEYPHARVDIADVFRFASRLASAFHESEQLAWSATAERLRGITLAATGANWLMPASRVCASPDAHRDGVATAGEFVSDWKKYCIDFMEELFGMFDILGERVRRAQLEKFLEEVN